MPIPLIHSNMKQPCISEMCSLRMLASTKLGSCNIARHASRSSLYGDMRLAMHISPASAKSFATSPEWMTNKRKEEDKKQDQMMHKVNNTRRSVQIAGTDLVFSSLIMRYCNLKV